MIVKSQNKDLVVDTYGNDFRMFFGSDGRYAIRKSLVYGYAGGVKTE